LQDKLEQIADFRSLKPIKAVARLKHLLTPAPSSHLWRLNRDQFEFIEEDFHQGCGFIPEDLVSELAATQCQANNVDSEQVRCIGPPIGVAKGMLLKKVGITKIQIPPSMRKALPSRKNKNEQWVYLITKGVYPTKPNTNIGRYLDPESKDPPKSFMERPAKRLSDMYFNLMQGLGVPSQVLERYRRNAMNMKGLRHTHLRGVLDPTGLLPEDAVYITGIIPEGLKKVFVTRSPCLEPSDAKVLKIVSSRPSRMPQKSWEQLCGYAFGHIIFPVPKRSPVPLPILVGEGDLDGDDYFVCWDDDILNILAQPKVSHRMKADEEEQRDKKFSQYDNEAEGPAYLEGSPNWLEEAQNVMLDFSVVSKANQIIGKLYSLSVKSAKESKDGIYDRDARAFARAYKDSLDTLKHGGVVELPKLLRDKITPRSLHVCFRWV
jgi:RNA dependent RNA polymerase